MSPCFLFLWNSVFLAVRLSYKEVFFKLLLCPGVLQTSSFATEFIRSRMGTSRRNVVQAMTGLFKHASCK